MAINPFAQQAVGGNDLAALQAQLTAQFPKQGFWTTPIQRQQRFQEFQAQKQAAIDAYLLPLQAEILRAQAAEGQGRAALTQSTAQQQLLENKQQAGMLAGANSLGVGLGMSGAGELQARANLMGPMEQLARANLMNTQTKSVAAELNSVDQDPLERIDHIMSGVMGLPDGSFLEMQRMNQAAMNASKSQQFDMQATTDALLQDLEGRASQLAGKPLELFTGQDHRDALALFQKKIAGGASNEDGVAAVLQAAARRAQARFIELTRAPEIQAATPFPPAEIQRRSIAEFFGRSSPYAEGSP